MEFEHLYIKYENYVHYLLRKYHIKYNYDEYFQMLIIRLWELEQHYDQRRSTNFHAYLRTKLHFYLIDLFRKQKTPFLIIDTHSCTPIAVKTSILSLELYFIKHQLTPKQQHWLTLHLQGYHQKEICEQLNCSLSTVKNYQRQTFAVLKNALHPLP